jgi:hypothetical protein
MFHLPVGNLTMDQAAEQKVLSTLYDRLFQAISYQPNSDAGPKIDKSNTCLFMAKNYVLNPKDYANAVSPLNPGQDANFIGAKAFSDLVDVVPIPGQVEWRASPQTVTQGYSTIVNGANSTVPTNEDAKVRYNKAYSFLNTKTEISNYDGPPTVSVGPAPIMKTYNSNRAAYVKAIGDYRTAEIGYDLSKTADQRQWMANQGTLQNAIDQTWDAWVSQGKANVEQAQQAMATSINNAVEQAIIQAQGNVNEQVKMAGLGGGGKWLLSYAQPSNWMDPSLEATTLTLKSSYLNKDETAESTSYSASAQGSYGLWSAGGEHSYAEQKSASSMQASTFELTAELIQVRIMRPWFNPLIFGMTGWKLDGYGKGDIPQKIMKWVSTSFVVCRNVTIKADFTSEDKTHFSSETQSKASVGWGPFSVSGSYSHSQSKDHFQSRYDAGGLQLPGLQVIGFVCSVVPPCPPG